MKDLSAGAFGARFSDLDAHGIAVHSDWLLVTLPWQLPSASTSPPKKQSPVKNFIYNFSYLQCLHYNHSYNKYISAKQTFITVADAPSQAQGQRSAADPVLPKGPPGGAQRA